MSEKKVKWTSPLQNWSLTVQQLAIRFGDRLQLDINRNPDYDPELRAYYQRKCGEGKHPKSVKNAVVCKLLYRAFAVINRGTPYVKLYEHEAIIS